MFGFVVRRLGAMVVMLFLLSIVTFGMYAVLPSDPAALTCGKSCSPQVIEANRVRLGLDKPLVEQYTTLCQRHLRRAHVRQRHADVRMSRALFWLFVQPWRGRQEFGA